MDVAAQTGAISGAAVAITRLDLTAGELRRAARRFSAKMEGLRRSIGAEWHVQPLNVDGHTSEAIH